MSKNVTLKMKKSSISLNLAYGMTTIQAKYTKKNYII